MYTDTYLSQKKRDMFQYVYVLIMCLYIFQSADVLWFERLPESILSLLVILVTVYKLFRSKNVISFQQFILCSCFFLYYFLFFFVWSWGSGLFFLSVPTHFLFVISVILLPKDEKILLLKAISLIMVGIILISVPVWLLFVAGFDLPHSDVIFHANGFHEYYDYYFFRLTAKNDDIFDLILPRFSSMFLEPGQFATPCVFLFYLLGAKLNWRNFPFIIAIILSFSLVGIVLMFFCIFARKVLEGGKMLIFRLSFVLIFIAGIFFCFAQYADETNPVNQFVISRLEFDKDKGFAGNNRTSGAFDRNYEFYMKTSDKYLGIHERLKEGNDWTFNCSGYKKEIVHFGIVGFTFLILFVTLPLLYNRNLSSLFFFIVVTISFFVRDLLQSPLWISIVIIGFDLLGKRFESNSLVNRSLVLY